MRRDLTLLGSFGRGPANARRRAHRCPHADEFTFSARDTHQLAEKEAIGRACAELIQPNQSVIIDAGTTTYHAATSGRKAPQIITNSLPVANLFGGEPAGGCGLGGCDLSAAGCAGRAAGGGSVHEFRADVAIMSAGGITLEGVSNSHGLLIDIQRSMIRAAQKVIFCMDHTKFGRHSVSVLCELGEIDTIVTDNGAPLELVGQLRAKGIEVVMATPGLANPRALLWPGEDA